MSETLSKKELNNLTIKAKIYNWSEKQLEEEKTKVIQHNIDFSYSETEKELEERAKELGFENYAQQRLQSFSKKRDEFSLDKVVVPPPFVKKVEALEFTEANIPGEIKIDISGKLLKTFFDYEGKIGSLVDQYNNFITYTFPQQVVSKTLEIENGIISFENVIANRPEIKPLIGNMRPLYPQEARNSGYSYTSDIYVDMVLNKGKMGEERIDKVFLGKVPVMLGSNLDWLSTMSEKQRTDMGESLSDPSGYFIIKGAEKVILQQEKLRPNRFMVFSGSSKGDVVCKITNNTLAGSTQISMVKGKKSGALKIHLGFLGRLNCAASNKIGKTISVLQVYRLLGVTEPKTMLNYIFLFTKPEYHKKFYVILQPNIVKLSKIGDDIEYISKKTGTGDLDYNIKKSNIMQELKNQLFPQVEHDNIQGKIYMLSIMIARIAEYLIGVRNLDDRDNWGNKQLATAGKSMELLFSSIWKELINSIQEEIGTKNLNSINSVKAAFHANFITDNFIESFSANKWGVQSKNSYMKKENITDILKRDSILSVYSHLTKVNTPGSDKVKNSKLRMVQMSQLGYIDPGETPEGKQCCKVGTPVLMSDGTWMSIEKIKNDSVVTVNSKTFKQESSKIIEPFLFDTNGTNKKIFRVTTINGRYLEATGDHPFLTQRGWVELKDLNLDNDQLCICPYQNPISNEIKDSVILTEDSFKSLLSKTDIKETIILKHIKELKLKGLLPLKTSHKYLHILARISGFAMADGCLGVYDNKPSIYMVFGQEIDGVDYVNDIVKLGFNKVKISYTENKITDKNTGREAIHKVYRVSKGGSLPSLLIALGLSYGEKTLNSRKPVPNFVLNGSKLIKREYLSGFQGGDGNAIHGSKRKNKVKAHVFGFSEVIQHMCEEYSDSLYSYMSQISKLFEELGVKMGKVKKYKDDKSDNFICSYTISCEENNLIKYMDVVGYRYASTKNMKSIKVVEYLRYKNLLIQERKEIKDKVITFYKNKKTIPEISKELNISYRSASSIVEYWKYAGDNTKSLPNPKNLIPYDEFNKVNCIKENKYIFLNIQKFEQIEDAEVADFTTVSDNHSFIANCFVTHNCGLAKNVSMTTYVSLDRPEEIIIETVRNYISDLRKDDKINPFILNGVFQGWVNGKVLKEICVDMKRSLKLPKDTCIVLEKDGFFNIYTDAGRPTRPLMIVDEDGTLVIEKKNLWKSDFETLIREGCIEYIDAWEQENIMLAQKLEDIDYRKRDIEMAERSVKQIQEKITNTKRYFDEEDEQKDKMFLSEAEAALKELLDLPRYTHSEMDPTAILSIAIGIIPLLETNPGPRLTYQAGMGKQSLGIYHSNHSKRFDTSAKVLAYPSRPMFETQFNDIIGLSELPAGETVIVGITTFTGYSQEDAIVMAQGSVDRGLFRSVVYKTYKSVLKPNEKFTRPTMKKGEEEKYAAIDENGIPILGASVKEGHVIIGKVRFNKRTEKKEDASTIVEVKQSGVIDKVLVTTNADNNRVIKVKIRQVRKPVIGDKFACYTPDHEVMTNNGWKNITELTKEDKVLTLNGFETPTEIQTYDYDGKMYSVESDNVNLCVTPNHRMYVKLNEKYEIMRADEIYGKKVTYKNLDVEYSEEGNDEWVHYTGKVHCCTVPSGIIYVRRQGKSVWCGNSRYAQKGTIGLIIPDEDMPYTASGMRPDILINPHCIPSRMTIGKLIEIVTSKTAAFTGERVNATAFRKFDVKDFMRNLTQYGYASSGKERMFSGYTGEPLEAMIFTGPCYYQALRHQVADKIQMRAKGDVSQLTRQPVEGRKRGGGLRVGEMERDAIISHGASNFLRERLCLVSDAYETVYCSTCGNIAISNVVEEKYICRNCDDKAEFGVCTVPFAFKTLSQLLMGAGFQTKFKMREIPK